MLNLSLSGLSVIVMTSGIFFFQAEDGIRDKLVTGVQTCALPIFPGQRLRVVSDVGQVRGKKAKRGVKARLLSAKPGAGKSGGRTRPASAPARRPLRHTAQR